MNNKTIVTGLALASISMITVVDIRTEYVIAQAKEEQQRIEQEQLELDIALAEKEKQKILKREGLIAEAKVNEQRLEKQRKASVTFASNDVRVVSNIKTTELKEVFRNIEGADNMVYLSSAFVDAEKVYGVNAFALAGIVALESSWNTSRRAIEQNNLTGYAVYSDRSYGKDFSSPYDCIMETARLLKSDYLSANGKWHNGHSTESINTMYSSDINWYNKVNKIGNELLCKYERFVLMEG